MGRFKQHKIVIENTLFLSVIEFVNMLVPILALPYVIKTIGKDNYGLVIFAQSIIAYIIIIINFGLNISAVKSVSENRHDKIRISQIVSSVVCTKFILWLIVASVYAVCIVIIPGMRNYWELYSIVFIATLFEIIFPQWYYQGVERMKYITLIKLISVAFYLSTLFVIVRTKNDFLYVPLLQSIGAVLSGVFGLMMLFFVEKVKYTLPSVGLIKQTFRDGIPFFFSQLSKTVNDNIAVTMAGILLGMGDAAILGVSKRIITFAATPGEMLCNALYPRNSFNKDRRYFCGFLKFIFLAVVIEVVIAYFLIPYVVEFFAGDTMPEAVMVTRFYLFYLMFAPVVTYVGYSGLIAFGHAKAFNVSIYISVFVQLLLYLLFFVTDYFNMYAFVAANILSMLSMLIYRIMCCRKYKLV